MVPLSPTANDDYDDRWCRRRDARSHMLEAVVPLKVKDTLSVHF